jgi:type IV pilus assembly protein PilV
MGMHSRRTQACYKQAGHRQTGTTLIEVLIAVLVSAIGIIGIGLMMLTTLRDSGSAMLRSRAVTLATDMAERIHANADADARALYVTTTGVDSNCSAQGGGTATACTPAQFVAHDIWEWQQALAAANAGLPGANGTIAADTTTTPPTYTIRIDWNGGVDRTGTAITETVSIQVRL